MIPILFDHDERDFTSQGICRLSDAVDCVVTEERNGIYELELKYPIDGLNFEEIYEGRLIGVTHDDNGDIQPFEIYKISAPLEGIVTFYAHHLSYRLRNLILTPFHASSCAQAMAQMAPKSMTRCPFSFWTDVGETGNFDVNYPVSIKEMLAGRDDSILNTYGPGEFEFDKWTVKFHEDRGVDHGVEIRYGKNLTAITREYDSSETYTAVVPYWYKEDDDGTKHLVTLDDYGVIVSDSDAIQHVYWTDEHGEIIRNEQGYPIEFDSANMVYAPLDLSSEFDEQPTQAELATAAKQLFDAAAPWVPEDSIKISFVALWQTPEYEDYAPLEKVSLCDYVRVIHTKIGVYTLAKVTKTVYNVLLDRYNSIELGVAAESYADRIMGDTKTTLEHIQHQLQRTVTADYVNEQIDSATDAITGGLGGYIKVTLNANNEPQEILVMDSPSVNTAVNVIRINQAGIGFSTNGYQGPFNSAWLIDGTFDAQVINVINLAATVIRTGYLTDVNGYNYWNLETGEFRLATTAYLDTYSENGYTATRAYAVGDMIEVKTPNDTLIYEVTQAIPVGGTITPGTNVQAATAHTLLDFARKAETVTDVDVEYASHTSSITPPPSDSPLWQTTSPAWELGKYIWQRTKMVDGNGTSNYSDPVCIQGAQGTNTAVVYLYKRSASAATIDWTNTLTYSFATNALTSTPSGWSESIPSGDDPLYMTAATASSRDATDTIPYTEWATPVMVAQNGEDAPKTAIVVLYKRSNTIPTAPSTPLTYTFATGVLSGSLSGWTQAIPAADGNPCYSIQAIAIGAEDTDTIAASEWTSPVSILSDGLDGRSTVVIYLYKRAATTPSKPNVQTTYMFSNDTLSPIPTGWSRAYLGGSDPLYVTVATASSTEDTDTINANEWSDPVILTQDGAPGVNGKNTATVRLYKRASSAPSIDWQNTLTYDFTTNTLTSVPTGWSLSVPDGDDDLYATAATASSATDTDTISANEWGTPVCITKNGLSWSTAAVFLYARAAASTDLTKPQQSLDYSFSTGILSRGGQTGPIVLGQWSQEIPTTDGNPCFVIQATAVSDDGQTDTIAASEWSDIARLVMDGQDGQPGANGRTTVVIMLYKRSATAPSINWQSTLTYTFATDTLSPIPSGWSRDIPSGTDPLYVTAATASSVEATDDIAYTEWSTPVIMAQNGGNGTNGQNTAMVYLYKRSATAPSIDWTNTLTYTFSTSSLSSIPSGWSRDIPSGTDPLYVTAATASSVEATDDIAYTEWSTPVILAQNGEDGAPAQDGLNSATVFLYARAASASVLTQPSSDLTYNFSTGLLSSIPSPWSQSIPTADGNPCFMIQATAISREATDTIASTEWSNIVELVADGSDGFNSATIFLYARAASASALTKPSSTLTYNFETKALTPASGYTGWSQTIPDSNANGDPCFVIQATAVATTATDTIAANEWSSIAKLVKDGENGTNGRNTAMIYLYKRSSAAVSIDWQTTLSYTFATNTLSPIPSGWSRDIPSGTDPLYVTAATASSVEATDDIAYTEWSTPVIMARDGQAASAGMSAATVFLYARAISASALTRPSSNLTYTFATGILANIPSPWSQTIPAPDANNNPCFVIQATAINSDATDTIESSEWSSIVQFVADGNDGEPGLNCATVFLYQRAASASALTKPSATLTYTFSSGALTPAGSLGGWSTVIPDSNANGDPCFVIQATAASTTATDTIAVNEWSEINKLVADGEDGKSISTITEYYARSTSNSTAPSSWQTTVPTLTSTYKYLWNYEVINYSDGSTSETNKRVIGVYGNTGTPGKGISSIVEYYAINNSTTAPQDSDFSSTLTNPTAANPYLWNYELITYTDSTTSSTDKRIIGHYGKDGKSISSITEYYALNNSTTAPQDSDFSTIIQNPTSSNRYLWNYELVTYSDTTTSSTGKRIIGTYGETGSAGKGISSIVEYYAINNSTTAPSKSSFSTSVVTPTAAKPYLWNYEVTTYTDNTTSETDRHIIGRYGKDGTPGKGISSVTEYYAINNATTAPADNDFSTTLSNPTASNPYLWNYEVITYTDNTTSSTDKRIIGHYGEDGSPGKGISSITNHYLATSLGSGVTKNTSGWTTSVQSMTVTNKYLWNYETITYTDSTTSETSPTIIGVYGDTGKGISDVQEQYYLSTSTSECTGGSWQSTQPAWSEGHYIWTRSKITWSDSSITYTTPICANAINGANEAVQNLDDSLTQDEVFSRLTNGFNTEGIFLENGRLFVNSTGIATGFIHDKSTSGGTNVEFYNEQNNMASRDYITNDYITHDGYACRATKNIYTHEWINNSSQYTTNVTRLGMVYEESSNIATRNYAANDYITFGGNLYQATVTINAGTTISSSDFNNCNLLGTCYVETGYYASRAYSSGNYIKFYDNLYQATTSIASGTMVYPGQNVTYLSLGSLYRNYWNLNTGQFVTARGNIAGFVIGTSTYNGSSWNSLFYMSAQTNGVYNWAYPYSAANTPIQGVGFRGSSESVNLGFNVISQGRMYLNGADTSYAGRIRLSAAMMYFDLGLNPSSASSSWTTVCYINPWSGTGGNGIDIHGTVAVTGNFAASGSKSRLIKTDGYGKRLLYSYETPSPMFGDIGEGQIGEDGLCYIWLEPIFAQAIESRQYQVFLQKYGEGDCYIYERHSEYFIVKGTVGLDFGWELKAKQKDYNMTRLENFDDTLGLAYGQENLIERTNEYLQNLREGREGT